MKTSVHFISLGLFSTGVMLSIASGCSSRSQLFNNSQGTQSGETAAAGAPSRELDNELGDCSSAADCTSDNLCEIYRCTEGKCDLEGETTCEVQDPCLEATCEPTSGACVLSPRAQDADGDGFFAPLPGFAPGEDGSCGDDCNDNSVAAFPGGTEVCDGVDNDCDGAIDNRASYLDPSSFSNASPLGSGEFSSSSMRSVIFAENDFYLGYWGKKGEKFSFFEARDLNAESSIDVTPLSLVNASSFGPALASTGKAFAGVWSDARVDNNYEVYFARFSLDGVKLAADIRVSDGVGFSVHSDLEFSQGQFYAVYDDHRYRFDEPDSGVQIIGRVLTEAGELGSDEVRLTDTNTNIEQPEIAATSRRIGLVASELTDLGTRIIFRSFDRELADPSPQVTMSEFGAARASIAAIGDDFMVIWDTYEPQVGPGAVIKGAVVSSSGEFIEPPRDLTTGQTFARSHSLVSLGDRVLLSWGDAEEGNYEIYAMGLDAKLTVTEPVTRITYSDEDSLSPYLALGRNGSLGIGFDDWSGGQRQGYFMTLGCNQPVDSIER